MNLSTPHHIINNHQYEKFNSTISSNNHYGSFKLQQQ